MTQPEIYAWLYIAFCRRGLKLFAGPTRYYTLGTIKILGDKYNVSTMDYPCGVLFKYGIFK